MIGCRRGVAATTVITLIVIAAVLAATIWWLKGGSRSDEQAGGTPGIFVVERGGFDITVPASGELAANRQIEIASQLDTRAVITEIVEEGDWVEAGDVLIRLDSESILDRIKDAELAVNNAETNLQTAQSNLKIRQDASVSQLSLADVDILLATLALEGWQEGTDVSRRQQLALDVETAEKDYKRLVARFEASKGLLDEEFISKDEYDRDEIEMIRAASRYEQAKLAQSVYDDYERKQQREKLEADLKRVTDARTEIGERNRSELTTLQAEVENRLVAVNRELERLERARRQFDQCTIIAPQAGLVVYASSLSTGRYGRNDNAPPQVGTELPRNRTVIVLPDTSKMVAEVKVNEALSGRIEKGQRAVVHCDATPDAPMPAVVDSVGVLAESGGWRDPNRRDYTVRVVLEGKNAMGLKPSMRCRADIFVGRVEDAVYIPVPAVFRDGPQAYVYVPDGRGYAQHPVGFGRSSELYIEVLDGLVEGDRVLLREPPSQLITTTLKTPDSPPATAMRPRVEGEQASGGPRAAGRGGGQRPGAGSRQPARPPAGAGGELVKDKSAAPKDHSRPGT